MRALIALFCATAYGQVVEGTVLDSVSGTPISGVAVQIGSRGKATTDGVGAFRVDGLADGTYRASLNKQGYDAPAVDPLRVHAGADPVRLTLKMVPHGKVSGRVLDADGNGVADAQVSLMGGAYNGQYAASGKDGTFTFDVSAGSYTLSAWPPKGMKPPQSKSGEKLGWVRTWYPGVPYAGGASRIVVAAGAGVWGQDVKFSAAPVHRILGAVLGTDGNPKANETLQATPTDGMAWKNIEAVSATDGSFTFEDLWDGNWSITAVADTRSTILRGSQLVTLAGHDAERVQVRLSAPFPVTVQMIYDPPLAGIEGRVPSVRLVRWGGGEGVTARTRRDGDGKLLLEAVYPGRYLVNPIGADRAYYLASVTMGGRDILGQYVELSDGALPIEVTYKGDGGTVRGSIENCAGAVVMMAPQATEFRLQELIYTGRCAADGRWEIRNARPGDYYALALAKFDVAAAEFLADLEDRTMLNRAAAVTVRAKEAVNAELRVW